MAVDWWLIKPLDVLRTQINRAYLKRDKASDGAVGDTSHGARKSDHNPDTYAFGAVRAIDVDKDLFGVGDSRNIEECNALIAQIIKDERVAYVIFMSRIWQNPKVFKSGGWHPYTSAGKTGWFNPHKEHFHISIINNGRFDNDGRPWSLNPVVDEIPFGGKKMFILNIAVPGVPGASALILPASDNGTSALSAVYYFPDDIPSGFPQFTVKDARALARMRQEIRAL